MVWYLAFLLGLMCCMHVTASADNTDTKFQAMLVKAFPPGFHTLFQGDSITDGGRDRRRKVKYLTFGQGYPYIITAKMEASFPMQKLQFSNHGISGNTLFDIQGRWHWDALDLKPDLISLLIGVNDIWKSVERNDISTFNYTEFKVTYVQMIKDALIKLPNIKIALCEPFILKGSHTADRWDEWTKGIKEIRTIVKSIADMFPATIIHVPFQNVFDRVSKMYPDIDPAVWLIDGVHPMAPGHQLMADEWLKVVAEGLIRLQK